MGRCNTCNCNPCQCNCSCDPQNEALSSAFLNFTGNFLGLIDKHCLNGQVVWDIPCNLGSDIGNYFRSPGEAIFCFWRRVLEGMASNNILSLGANFGALIVGDGSIWEELTVGSDGQFIVADSLSPLGLKWTDVSPGSGAPATATYMTRVPEAGLSNEFAWSLMATGLVKNTTGTGVPVIAVNGTDFYGPGFTIPISDGGTGQTTQTAAFDALSPTTTKGDMIVNNGTNNVRIPVSGNDGSILIEDSTQADGVRWGYPSSIPGGAAMTNYTLIRETQPTSTNGGTMTSGSYQNRILNDLNSDAGGNVLAGPDGSGVVNIRNGTYRVSAMAMGTKLNSFDIQLWNVTDGVELVAGLSEKVEGSSSNSMAAKLEGRFTILAAKDIALRMRSQSSQNSNGRGDATGWKNPEIYAYLKLEREI